LVFCLFGILYLGETMSRIVVLGAGIFSKTAASITVYPVVPDFERYPEYGRDLLYTFGEIGLAGHWIKLLLHYRFIYKAKLKPFWFMLPE
jgi:sulfide:quinone oxidoreductase